MVSRDTASRMRDGHCPCFDSLLVAADAVELYVSVTTSKLLIAADRSSVY